MLIRSNSTSASSDWQDWNARTAGGHLHLEVSSLAAYLHPNGDTLGSDVGARASDALFVVAVGYQHVGADRGHRRWSPPLGRDLTWFEFVLPDKRPLDELAGDG